MYIGDVSGNSCGAAAASCLVRAGVKLAAPSCSEQPTQVTPDTTYSSGDINDHRDIFSDDESEVLSPMTCHQGGLAHISMLEDPSQTLIIFDWDDTICPTSYIWSREDLRWDRPAPPEALESLKKHTLAAESLLRLASSLGKVYIVTLARDAWVSTSIDHFMPGLRGLLDELEIDIVYARSAIAEKTVCGMIADELRDAGQALKTVAMRHVVENGTWTSAISVGDSDAEFYSIQDVVFHHKQTGDCACKAVKLASKPDLATLTIELEGLLRWLPSIVDHSLDLELDFEDLVISSSESP